MFNVAIKCQGIGGENTQSLKIDNYTLVEWTAFFATLVLFMGAAQHGTFAEKCPRGWLILAVLVLIGYYVGMAAAQEAPAASAPPAGASAPPQANAAPPPSAAPQKSTNDLQKLAAPIALYPDALIAVVLPASAYPLEIVQAARFVKDTNNIAKLDDQQWDDNVKAVARYPQVISQMDDNLSWTSDLGDAFINQPKELMDAIQVMRTKAQDSGALKTTPQQTVTVTNEIVTNTVQSEIVYVTNEVVQIQPSQPDVIYVPQYNPTVVYSGYPVAYPGYAYPPYYPGTVAAASIVSFGAGMAMGAWMANGCDWGHGGCWNGGGNYHSDVNIKNNVTVNNNRQNFNNNRQNNGNRQKWQPNQNRLKSSGSSLSSAQNREARGWGNGSSAANRSQNGNLGNRSSTGTAANRAQTGNVGNRAGTGTAANRPSTGTAANRPSTGTGNRTPGTGSSVANRSTRPSTGATGTQAGNRSGNLSATGNRSSGGGQARSSPSANRSGDAFGGGGNAASARSSSARGASSRGFSGGGGGGSRGGGGRGGGGRGGGRR